jgi:hypothetical protein
MSLNFPRIPVHESRDKKLLGAAAPGQEKKICSGRARQVPEEKRAYNISTIFSCAGSGSELRQIKKICARLVPGSDRKKEHVI